MSRAGLVSLILFFLYITLVVSAPLPERLSSDIHSFATRSGDFDHDLVIRSLAFDLLEDRDLPSPKERDFDIADGNYYTREVTNHAEQLHRRSRSKITQKIKAGSQRAVTAMKNVSKIVGGSMPSRIHAGPSKKLDKGMRVMDKPQKIVDHIP